MASECAYSHFHAPPAVSGQGLGPSSMRSSSSAGSSGRDSADPRWRSHTVNSTYIPICRNSLSQFSMVADMK